MVENRSEPFKALSPEGLTTVVYFRERGRSHYRSVEINLGKKIEPIDKLSNVLAHLDD